MPHDQETETAASTFAGRHIGPRPSDTSAMLKALGYPSLDALSTAAVPRDIARREPLDLPAPKSEADALDALRRIASKNRVLRSYLGMGYHDCLVPGVIQRNVLESPGWYTQYTPYQAEIAQGRLEALLNFQTMVTDLTGMEIANASLLDEGTAAAEGMALCHGVRESAAANRFFIADDCHPQTVAVVHSRAEALGWEVVTGPAGGFTPDAGFFGMLLSYPATDGRVVDYTTLIEAGHRTKTLSVVVADLLALTLLKAPGEMGADVVVGNTQRFGVPLGYGGPHAAFFATRSAHQRRMPGRIVGVSRDRDGEPAIRLVLQTREQHIRRDKATSNICTAQVLLAVMAGMYAVYHGPEGLRHIAGEVHRRTRLLAAGLRRLGFDVGDDAFFDTLQVRGASLRPHEIVRDAEAAGMNLRAFPDAVGIALDEATGDGDVEKILAVFAGGRAAPALSTLGTPAAAIPPALERRSEYLMHPVFRRYRSETEMLRYVKSLEAKDLSLTHSMIPLGSCTMKLNATSEMYPVSWPEISRMHPFVPEDQAQGYRQIFSDLERWLAEITGFAAVSLQPNSGAQGEYAGLLVIRAHHLARREAHRNVCLIPRSAHGTNPASAVMVGMQVVTVECDEDGNIDLADLRKKAETHAQKLSALMVTYPSTHGVFEEGIREICDVVHRHGGQVYMDGANMNAQVGLCRPGDYGPDVCHLNLHKTFCIPHGGGGPGMGPIAVAAHLAPYLPGHPVVRTGGEKAIGPVSAAPWGSASILVIPWMYLAMMGSTGLRRATEIAVLNANYVAKRLEPAYPVLFRGKQGLVAHECIVDLRDLKKRADIEVEDVAKRLIDYGYHAPTISWPVPGTMMIEPTESESKEELDRFCEAMLSIHAEAMEVAAGKQDRKDNLLKNAPHTARDLVVEDWKHGYTRERAVFPSAFARARKFWPSVARIDNAYGDRNLFCTCPPLAEG